MMRQTLSKSILLVFALLGALNFCQTATAKGIVAEEALRPIFVMRGEEMLSFCSGTLISSRWILTVGHCVLDLMVGEDAVNPDEIQIIDYKTQQSLPAKNFLSLAQYQADRLGQKEFQRTAENDLALIRLDTPVTLASYPRVAPLKPSANGVHLLTSVGFGYAFQGQYALQKPDWSKLVSNTYISRAFKGDGVSNLLVTKMDALVEGDSGGPVLNTDDEVVGVNEGWEQSAGPLQDRVTAISSREAIEFFTQTMGTEAPEKLREALK